MILKIKMKTWEKLPTGMKVCDKFITGTINRYSITLGHDNEKAFVAYFENNNKFVLSTEQVRELVEYIKIDEYFIYTYEEEWQNISEPLYT